MTHFYFVFSFFHCRLFFLGQVTIELHVDKETNFIVLHAQDLNITEKVRDGNSAVCK